LLSRKGPGISPDNIQKDCPGLFGAYMLNMIEDFDSEKIYCRKLGHHVSFKYCRGENEGLPCARILDCWFERLPIEDFIRTNYTEEECARIFAPQKYKTESDFSGSND
jgi:hypothetical protein